MHFYDYDRDCECTSTFPTARFVSEFGYQVRQSASERTSEAECRLQESPVMRCLLVVRRSAGTALRTEGMPAIPSPAFLLTAAMAGMLSPLSRCRRSRPSEACCKRMARTGAGPRP